MSEQFAETEHRVTPFALFFDLVFVFGFTEVTTLLRECLMEAIPAASSQSFITVPPWTKPAVFASSTPIHSMSVTCVAAAGRGSIDRYASSKSEVHPV